MRAAAKMIPEVVFVLGAPGSGKGTQCQNIVREFGFVHLSAGDLLRAERARPGSQYGEMIERDIREGRIVPVAVTCALLEAAMAESGRRRFLIDGFPRNQDNLEGWASAVGERARLLFVLFLECEREACVTRCLARGAAGSGRSDDNPDSLRLRFDTYQRDTLPVVQHYERLGLLRAVAAGAPPNDVFAAVSAVFRAAGVEPGDRDEEQPPAQP